MTLEAHQVPTMHSRFLKIQALYVIDKLLYRLEASSYINHKHDKSFYTLLVSKLKGAS